MTGEVRLAEIEALVREMAAYAREHPWDLAAHRAGVEDLVALMQDPAGPARLAREIPFDAGCRREVTVRFGQGRSAPIRLQLTWTPAAGRSRPMWHFSASGRTPAGEALPVPSPVAVALREAFLRATSPGQLLFEGAGPLSAAVRHWHVLPDAQPPVAGEGSESGDGRNGCRRRQ